MSKSAAGKEADLRLGSDARRVVVPAYKASIDTGALRQ